MYIYIYIYIYMCIYVCVCIYVCMCIHEDTYRSIQTNLYIYMWSLTSAMRVPFSAIYARAGA